MITNNACKKGNLSEVLCNITYVVKNMGGKMYIS